MADSTPLTPPIHVSSAYTFADLDQLDRVMDGEEPGFIYARDGHPNALELAERLRQLHTAAWGVVTASGMGALSAACLACTQTGGRIIASDRLYGRTTQLLRTEMARFGIRTEFVDTNDLDATSRALEIPADMLIIETISNPMLRVADVPRLAELTRTRGTKLLVDNTFASPILFQPLQHGADLVMESLTKIISGHGDTTLGFLAGSQASFDYTMKNTVSVWGLSANPFDCWLTLRGLETLELRMHQAASNAQALSRWCQRQKEFTRVIYPTLPDHPDQAICQRLLSRGAGAMVSLELPGGREAVNRFFRGATGIRLCPSLGDTATTFSYPDRTSHRYVPIAEKRQVGITEGLIRMSVGIESAEQIARELQKGLAACG